MGEKAMSIRKLGYAPVLLLLSAAACAPAHPVAEQPLGGVPWRLTSLGAEAVPVASGQQAPFLRFDEAGRSVSGSGGCNRLVGGYETADGRLKIGPLASTRMACLDDTASARETRFLAALEAVGGYRIEGQSLRLLSGQGRILAELKAGQE
jgi:heat shock protein HslJ